VSAFLIFARAGLSGIYGFLRTASAWQILCLALGGVYIYTHFELVSARHSAARWEKQFNAEHAGRVADRTAYQSAQKQAAQKNQADIQRTEQRQKEISDARIANLNDRLVLITNELRNHPSSKGSAGSTPLPETGPTPCRAFDPAWLCVSPADRLHAAKNEERQDQLIDWVIQQSQVDPNAGAAAKTQ
jgi:hypothetical protein